MMCKSKVFLLNTQEKRAKKLQKQQIYKKIAQIFGQFKKCSYLCTRKTGNALICSENLTSRSGAVGSSPGS